MMSEAKIISIEGAVDLHLHSGPSVFQRPYDDVTLARAAANAGMKALVYKDHFEDTASRAYYANKYVPEIKSFGCIVLNRYMGGLNPYAVEASLVRGTKLVMMPTIDAQNHADIYGSTGHYQLAGKTTGARSSYTSKRMVTDKGLSILSGSELVPEVKDIVQLTQQFDAILGTGHLSNKEIFALVEYASSINFNKIILTHVNFRHEVKLTLKEINQLLDSGTSYAEFMAACVFPPMSWNDIPIVEWMQTLRPDRCVISSDTGSPLYPICPEALRCFAQNLYENGITEEELTMMMNTSPSKLLGID